MKENKSYEIQKKVGIVLTFLTTSVSILNFINGIVNYNDTAFKAFIHISVMEPFIISIFLTATIFYDYKFFRILQVTIILATGFGQVLLNEPGDLTSTLFLLFGMTLAYQYQFFLVRFYLKTGIIISLYILGILTNIFFIGELKLPFGIPSIIFTIITIYLFWVVFQQEIKQYLVRTNQLEIRLGKTENENIKLNNLTMDQAELLREKNIELENKIRELTDSEKKLRGTIDAKNTLLKEVHHRVKNNLAVIIGLLNLQRSETDDEELDTFIDANTNRLHAMASLHELIYTDENTQEVNLTEYLRDISSYIADIFVAEGKNITISIPSMDISIEPETALPLGIIFTDSLSNSIIYAFEEVNKNLHLTVEISDNHGNTVLKITDNNKLKASDISGRISRTFFGNWLIKTLAEDYMLGSVETGFDKGNYRIINFSNRKSDVSGCP